MPSYRCKYPTCTAYVCTPGYCSLHAQLERQDTQDRHRRYDRHQRNREAKRFYDSLEWRATRANKLAANPWCERCEREPATQVHHDTPLMDDWTKRVDHANLVSLCAGCHSTIEKQRRRT